MRVTQARLDRYRADVDAYGDAAATYVEQYLRALMAENPSMTVAELRDEAIAAIDDSLNAFGDQASAIALDLFEEVVAAYGIEPDTEIESVIPHEMVEGGVRYSARDLVEGMSGAFARDVADLSRYYVHRSAFENMERNCERNDIRYARVPSGRETCGFCFMLSSRGFVYRSEETAGSTHAYHDHCDCVVVPGFKDLPASEQIEGYDPEAMLDRWHECQATVGTDAELRERWKSMTDKQRARYKGNTDGERYRRFVNAQAIREAETRDFRWLNTGEVPRLSYASQKLASEIEQSRPWEKRTADRLAENGFRCEFIDDREEVAPGRFVGLPDLADGMELKTLMSARGTGAIDRQLRDAAHKKGLRCCVIDNSDGVLPDDGCMEAIVEKMGKRGVSNVLFIDSTGRLHRFIDETPKGP